MQLVSQCTLSVGKLLWRPSHGGYAFTVVCKATFELEPNLSALAHEQEPIVETNEWAESGSLIRATDLVPFKKRPEVLLVGHAYSPGGRPVTSLVTRVVVGAVDKSILVIGDRYVATDGRVGEAAAFDRMPLVWERAVATPDNPVGKQFGLGNRGAVTTSEWSLAPNLYPVAFEWPRPGMPIAPMAYAPISPLWPTRHGRLQKHAAGWDPHRWNERALPGDFDFTYMNAAPNDQQRTAVFGDDALYLENLHPELPRLSTRLDNVAPTAVVDLGTGPEPLPLRCDTLLVDTNRGLAILVWRGHFVVDHPDRPSRVIVTTQNNKAFSAPEPENPEPPEAVTLIPGVTAPRRSTILPFKSTPTSSAVSQASPDINRDRPDLSSDSDGTVTIVPHAPSAAAAALPFVRSSRESPPTRGDSLPFKPASPTVSSGLAAWKQLGSDMAAPAPPPKSEIAVPPAMSGTPFTPPVAPAPPPMRPALGSSPDFPPPPPMRPALGSSPDFPPGSPMGQPLGSAPILGSAIGLGSVGVLAPAPVQTAPVAMASQPTSPSTKSASPEEDLENRLRLVQRAIWKGDRPIEQILTAHGFTELEWRAAKRASVRKSAV